MRPPVAKPRLLTAYYLVANRSADTPAVAAAGGGAVRPGAEPGRPRPRRQLAQRLGLVDPASADPADKEHVEPFPQGRTNHYFTDLNRDWLALTQQDSRPEDAR